MAYNKTNRLQSLAATLIVALLALGCSVDVANAAKITINNACDKGIKVAVAYADENAGEGRCDRVSAGDPRLCIINFRTISTATNLEAVADAPNNCVFFTAFVSTDEKIKWGDGDVFDLFGQDCGNVGSNECYQWSSIGGELSPGGCAPLNGPYEWKVECPQDQAVVVSDPATGVIPPPVEVAAPPAVVAQPPAGKPPKPDKNAPPVVAPAPAPIAPSIAPSTTTVPVTDSTPTGDTSSTDSTSEEDTSDNTNDDDETPTTSTGTTSGTVQEDSTESDSSSNTAAIVGGVIGGVALLAIIAALIFFIKKKRSRNNYNEFNIESGAAQNGSFTGAYVSGVSRAPMGAKTFNEKHNKHWWNSFSSKATAKSASMGHGGLNGTAVAATAAAGAGAVAAGVYVARKSSYDSAESMSNSRQVRSTSTTGEPPLLGAQQPGSPTSPRVQWSPAQQGVSPYGPQGSGNTSAFIDTPNSQRGMQSQRSGSFTSQQSGGFNPSKDPLLAYLSTTKQDPRMVSNASRGRGPSTVLGGYDRHVEDTWAFDWEELEIVKPIGEGGFGKVYAARWKETMIAVKVLLRTVDDPEEVLSMSNPVVMNLKKEAILLSTLRHPNIVIFMGICSSPPAIATEYCARGSLMRILSKGRNDARIGKQLTWTRRLNIALDAAKGMLYLHAHNPPIIHRDLKSPNLLVDEHWRAKVTDFNLSRIITDNFYASKSLDATNPRWLAPEVLKGESATAANDVYAFGVVLWELLTWDLPWGPVQPWSVVASVTSGGRPTIPDRKSLPGPDSGKWPLLDRYIDLMNACWAQDANARPHFQQIVVGLRQLLEQTGGLSPSDTFMHPDSLKS